jgi:hypothetical protein
MTNNTDKKYIIDASSGEHITELLFRGFRLAVSERRTILVRHNDRVISIGVVST